MPVKLVIQRQMEDDFICFLCYTGISQWETSNSNRI